MRDCISRQAAIDAFHTWFKDGFDEDKWWNSTHVLAAIEGLPPVQQEYKWETCFDCPLSHGCPKIKGCTNEQAMEYASQIPNDCPLSAQSEPLTDKEQRIFLAAMGREEKVCKQVDEEWRVCREHYEDSLVRVCHEITRKVKGALWT